VSQCFFDGYGMMYVPEHLEWNDVCSRAFRNFHDFVFGNQAWCYRMDENSNADNSCLVL
jgi:hypothetical protein